jgi:hypothetical protein
MRALHAFLTTVSPLVILSACEGRKNDVPPPPTDSLPSQVKSTPPLPRDSGSFIVSIRLLMPDGEVRDVRTPDSTDAVFTTVSVLDSILIPYYAEKKTKEGMEMADSLRRSRTLIGNPHAYARHRLTSRSSVEAIE